MFKKQVKQFPKKLSLSNVNVPDNVLADFLSITERRVSQLVRENEKRINLTDEQKMEICIKCIKPADKIKI